MTEYSTEEIEQYVKNRKLYVVKELSIDTTNPISLEDLYNQLSVFQKGEGFDKVEVSGWNDDYTYSIEVEAFKYETIEGFFERQRVNKETKRIIQDVKDKSWKALQESVRKAHEEK